MPQARYVDAVSARGLASLDLPPTLPAGRARPAVGRSAARPIGAAAWEAGEPGIACRSAAPGAPPGGEELALFDRGCACAAAGRQRFERWYRGR